VGLTIYFIDVINIILMSILMKIKEI